MNFLNKKSLQKVLLITVLMGAAFWFTIHDSRLAEAGWSSATSDFLLAFFIPLTAALSYELIAAKIQRGSHKIMLAGAITILVCLLWYELADNGIHETVGILFG